jgi:hypothetical protein
MWPCCDAASTFFSHQSVFFSLAPSAWGEPVTKAGLGARYHSQDRMKCSGRNAGRMSEESTGSRDAAGMKGRDRQHVESGGERERSAHERERVWAREWLIWALPLPLLLLDRCEMFCWGKQQRPTGQAAVGAGVGSAAGTGTGRASGVRRQLASFTLRRLPLLADPEATARRLGPQTGMVDVNNPRPGKKRPRPVFQLPRASQPGTHGNRSLLAHAAPCPVPGQSSPSKRAGRPWSQKLQKAQHVGEQGSTDIG